MSADHIISTSKYHSAFLRLASYLLLLSCAISCDEQEVDGSTSDSNSETELAGETMSNTMEAGEAQSGQQTLGGDSAGEERDQDQACRPQPTELPIAGQKLLTERCGVCHGSTPQYGAPYSLNNLEELTSNEEGLRHLERSVARLLEGTMPPAGQPSPTPEEAQAFIDWATCGNGGTYVTPPGGFEVDRPVYQGPASAPANALYTDYIAPNTPVSPDQADDYQCFIFKGPSDPELDEAGQPRSILRFEPVIDEARVVHHIVLYETDRDLNEDGEGVSCGAGLGAAIYAWAPGQPPLHFREGGLVSGDEKRYVLEIHYNNGARLEGLSDSSGVRIYHSSLVEPQIDMMTMGPEGFVLPPRQRTEVQGDCLVEQELEIVAMMPHMHEIGVELSAHILPAGQSDEWEDLINLSGWDFNAQLVYDGEARRLYPGDRVRTRCLFENEGNSPRSYGPFTEDEMCYHFVYVTPPPDNRRCDVAVQDPDGTYPVGVCAPESIDAHQAAVSGVFFEGEPSPLAGGSQPQGLFTLSSLEMWFPTFDLGIAVLDPELSFFDAAGAMEIDEVGQFSFDIQGEINLISADGAMFMRALNLSFGGTLTPNGNDPSELTASISCPEAGGTTFFFESTSSGDFILYLPFSAPIEGVQVMTFSPLSL